MNLRCLFRGHDWHKLGGPMNAGNGVFKQTLVCERCGKRRVHRS